MTTLEISARQLAETIRHNKATEAMAQSNLEELIRHQQATEEIGSVGNVNDFIAAQNQFELGKLNASIAAEQNDVAWFNAYTQGRAVDVQQQNADTAETNAETSKGELAVKQGQLAVSQTLSGIEALRFGLESALNPLRANQIQSQTALYDAQVHSTKWHDVLDFFSTASSSFNQTTQGINNVVGSLPVLGKLIK